MAKYEREYAIWAEKLCKLGATNAQLADAFSVAESTIDTWIKNIPDFGTAVKAGRVIADANVADSLFRRALGWENPKAVKIFMPAGADEPVYAPYTEIVPPDTTACIFWLKNRRPDLWRDAHRHEHTGKDGAPLPDVELARRLAFVLSQASSEAETPPSAADETATKH